MRACAPEATGLLSCQPHGHQPGSPVWWESPGYRQAAWFIGMDQTGTWTVTHTAWLCNLSREERSLFSQKNITLSRGENCHQFCFSSLKNLISNNLNFFVVNSRYLFEMKKILKYLDYCISSWIVIVYLFASDRDTINTRNHRLHTR